MRDIFLIARREYLEQVRGKAFKVTTIMIPLVFAGLMALLFFSGRYLGAGKRMTVAASDPALAAGVRDQLVADKEAHMNVSVAAPATESDRKNLVSQVDRNELDGFLWLQSSPDGQVRATYESRPSGDFSIQEKLNNAVNDALLRQGMVALGVPAADADSMMKRIDVRTIQISNGREVATSPMTTFLVAEVMAFLLTFTLVMYGMNVGRSVIQEKTSRIFEVMLSTVKASDMLAGKLIGIGAVGLTQIGIWAAAALLFTGSALATQIMAGGFKVELSIPEVALFVAYYLLGYALYSTMFAGLASTCDTEQELQQYTPLAIVPVWLSFGMLLFIVNNPHSIWTILVSIFPLCAPITMVFSIAAEFPPIWEIALSLGLMVLSVLGMLWFSSRIYRIGILMYGKRATLPEILRWMRYS
jgi:ABC-2 type transport system permease protein